MEWTIGIDYPAWGNNEMYLKKIKTIKKSDFNTKQN